MVLFVADLTTWDPTIMGKPKNMRLRTRVWAQAPKASSFTEQLNFFGLLRGRKKSTRKKKYFSWVPSPFAFFNTLLIPRVAFQKIERNRKRKRKHHLRLRCQLRLRLVNVVTKGGPYEFLN